MTVCAVVFIPWALPRETISGFMGRMAARGSRLARAAAVVIDLFHWGEPGHCHDVHLCEKRARRELYQCEL